jgi:hypothetical protein
MNEEGATTPGVTRRQEWPVRRRNHRVGHVGRILDPNFGGSGDQGRLDFQRL